MKFIKYLALIAGLLNIVVFVFNYTEPIYLIGGVLGLGVYFGLKFRQDFTE